ncbi:hypothetical protein [Enterovibrio baiacu]|uniref:hypothetical protein n=1 Tax=Enterovibrio baiacu TaxID=2491023 RepID=UPI003D14B32D
MSTIDASKVNTPLEESERVLWCGQPHQGRIHREGDSTSIGSNITLLVILLPIVLIGSISIADTPSSALPIFLLAMVVFYFLYGKQIHDQYIRKNTVYVVTNKRAIIERKNLGGSSLSIKFTPETKIQVTRFIGQPFGTVRFWTGKESKYTKHLQDVSSDLARQSGRHFNNDTVFDCIDGMEEVYNILRQQLKLPEISLHHS